MDKNTIARFVFLATTILCSAVGCGSARGGGEHAAPHELSMATGEIDGSQPDLDIVPAIPPDGGNAVVTVPSPESTQATDADVPVAFSLHFEPQVPVSPGGEGVHCLDVVSPDIDTWVSGWTVDLSVIHHLNVWIRDTTKTDLPTYPVPTPCDGGASLGTIIFDSSQGHLVTDFGAVSGHTGAALHIPPNTALVLDVHYLNTSTQSLRENGLVSFHAAVTHTEEVTSLQWTKSGGLAVPPGSEQVLSYSCRPPAVTTDIIMLTSHSHAHDREVQATIDGQRVYDSVDYSHPALNYYSALSVGPSSTVQFSCDIENSTGATIGWGTKLQTTEMCQVMGLAVRQRAWTCAGTPPVADGGI